MWEAQIYHVTHSSLTKLITTNNGNIMKNVQQSDTSVGISHIILCLLDFLNQRSTMSSYSNVSNGLMVCEGRGEGGRERDEQK